MCERSRSEAQRGECYHRRMQTHPFEVSQPNDEPDRQWSSEALDGSGEVFVELWIEPTALLVYTRPSDGGDPVPMSDPSEMLGTVLGFMCDMQDRIIELEETVMLLEQEPS